jgi:hypothetical protein
VRDEVARNRELHPVILHPSDSFTNSCRHVSDQLQLFVRTAWARVRSRPSHRTKWRAMGTLLSVRDRVIVSVKWISNTDVLVDAEPAPPNLLLTCYTSKPPPLFVRICSDILHPLKTGWAHPFNLSRLPHY